MNNIFGLNQNKLGLVILGVVIFIMAFIFNISSKEQSSQIQQEAVSYKSPNIDENSKDDSAYRDDLKKADANMRDKDKVSDPGKINERESSFTTEIIEKYWSSILIGFTTGVIIVLMTITVQNL